MNIMLLCGLAGWLGLLAIMLIRQHRQKQQQTQRQRYLQRKVVAEKGRPAWLGFYTRLETLIGARKLERIRLYFILAVALALAALISQGMSLLVASLLVLFASLSILYFAIKHFEQVAVAQFNRQMPDIIDSMERAVKVGAPLHDIFYTLAQQYSGSAQRLFMTMHDRLKVGYSVEKVMQYAHQQMPSQEFQFLTILLSLQNETGGKLSYMLHQLGQTLRERSLMESRVRTITSESRTSAKVLAVLPFALIAILYSSAREHFDYLLSDATGQWVLFYVLGSVFLGLMLIRQLTKVKG